MLQETMVEAVGQAITRRRFLAKLGKWTLGMAMALLVSPIGVEASHGYCHGYFSTKCCNLCCPPGNALALPYCSGQIHNSAKWCWQCAHSDGWVYLCYEAKDVGAQCNVACDKVYASWVQATGDPAQPGELR